MMTVVRRYISMVALKRESIAFEQLLSRGRFGRSHTVYCENFCNMEQHLSYKIIFI